MNVIIYFYLLIAISDQACYLDNNDEYSVLTISVPVHKPVMPDAHLSAVCPLPNCHPCYITSFEPSPALSAAHHSGLRVCEKTNGPYCDDNGSVLGGWMHNVYTFRFPNETGYKIGKDTIRKFISLRAHIFDAERFNALSDSNIYAKVFISKKKLKPVESAMLETTDGELLPQKYVKFDISCVVPKGVSIQITSFMGHTHDLGILVSGYVVKNCPKNCEWNLIGKVNPTHSHDQKFLQVERPIIVKSGDILAARCTYFNSKSVVVNMGMFANDEMCKFFILGISNSDDYNMNFCPKPGNYTWESDSNLKNIPDGA